MLPQKFQNSVISAIMASEGVAPTDVAFWVSISASEICHQTCDFVRYPADHRKTAQPGRRTSGEETREQGKRFH